MLFRLSRRNPAASAAALTGAAFLTAMLAGRAQGAPAADWSIRATTIEACSCPMFCQCYFEHTQPAGHHGADHQLEHYCRANLAHKVERGHYGSVQLDGVKFWEAADLGGDFTRGFDWMRLHFDPSVSQEQRAAVLEIYNGHVKPLQYRSFEVGEDAEISWRATAERAEAKLAGGRLGEVVLRRNPSLSSEPARILQVPYFGAARHDGFVLMPNEIEAYRGGEKPFEFRGTTGFMITYELSSADVAARAPR
jgi:hypothetical protein